MKTTDPAFAYRNKCLTFLTEAYNFSTWDAFVAVAHPHFTRCFEKGASVQYAVNEYLMREQNAPTG